MIHSHSQLYKKLSSELTVALWQHLHERRLVIDPPIGEVQGEDLAKKCSHLSHAEVVLAIANKSEPFWCDILCNLLEKPLYLCARGETSVPLFDIEGRPLPLPIGHRRGQAVGTGGMPRQIAQRIKTHQKYDPRVIVKLTDENPKTPFSKAYERFSLYSIGMSVNEYLAIGGKPEDIKFDTLKGYIAVDMP